MAQTEEAVQGVVVIDAGDGHTVIERNTPLKRLHYFDGKFLRAPDMQLEQQALLNQMRLGNQAGGHGVVHGFDCLLDGEDGLRIGGGLAIDAQGRVLQLGGEVQLGIAELISRASALNKDCQCDDGSFGDCEKASAVDAPGSVLAGESLYVISLHYVEAYCGEEDVYGQLCQDACVSGSQRPYILPGVEIRAIPLTLDVLLKQSAVVALSGKHLRSRVASAYFEQERRQALSHISKEGLSSNIWCLGAEALGGNGVPIAVLGRAGSQTLFLDAWTARRERMEAPARQYWAGRMAMRAWQIFLAQVLQFQCQLSHCLSKGGTGVDDDPCADERAVAAEAAEGLKVLLDQYAEVAKGLEKMAGMEKAPQVEMAMGKLSLAGMRDTYAKLMDVVQPGLLLPTRWLIDCGIVELPSGGYLPVDNTGNTSINDQVARMMGEGVDLRFCVVRPDYIPHALEEAQHMERICLLQGLDDPQQKPRVDVLVPEGLMEAYKPEAAGTAYEMEVYPPEKDQFGDLPIKFGFGMARNVEMGAKKNAEAMNTPGYLKKILLERNRDKQPWLEVRPGFETEAKKQGLLGAARGETLDSGGYAFHFAGRMPPLVRGLVQLSAEALNIHEIQLHEATARRMSDLIEEANSTHAETHAQPLKEKVDTTPIIKQNYDMWLSLRCDRDPFSLSRGASCNISFELSLMFERAARDRKISYVIEVNQQGSLVVDEIIEPAPTTGLRCTLSSNGMFSQTTVIDGERQSKPQSLRINEQVYLRRSAGSQLGFSISVPELAVFNQWDKDWLDIDIGLDFERRWDSADEASFKAGASFRFALGKDAHDDDKDTDTDTEKETEEGMDKALKSNTMMQFQEREIERDVTLFSGRQKINPEVLKPDHVLHDTSLVALDEIGKVLADGSYADIRARLLFPPPQPVPKELRVFAKHDWVMFHRRRDIQCGYETPVEPVNKPRRYRLLHVDSLKSREDLLAYRDALLNNRGDVIMRFGFDDVGDVEFEAGLQTVLSSHNGLRSDWRNAVQDEQAVVMLGVIASRGDAQDEGALLAKLRLQRLSEVLAPVTPLDEEGRLAKLPKVPDVMAEGDSDGVIILATVAPQTDTICHKVYRAELNNEAELETFIKMLTDRLDETLKNDQLSSLAHHVNFADAASVMTDVSVETLKGDWFAKSEAAPVHGILVLPPDAATGAPPSDQPYAAQMASIMQVLGGNPTQNSQSTVLSEGEYAPCSAITVMAVMAKKVEGFWMGTYGRVVDDSGAATPIELDKQLLFNDAGEVLVNAKFETALNTIKETGGAIKSVDILKTDSAISADTRKKAQRLLAKLKSTGLVAASAKVHTRAATAKEKEMMLATGESIQGGFILQR